MERTRSEPPAEAQPHQSSEYLHERKAEMLENLDVKVAMVSEFEKTVRSITLEDSPAHVRQLLKSKLDEVATWLPQPDVDRYLSYQQVMLQVLSMLSENKETQSGAPDAQPLTEAETEERMNRQHGLMETMGELSRNNNVRFLQSLEAVTTALIKKNSSVVKLGNDQGQMINELHRQDKKIRGIQAEDIVAIDRDPFGIYLTVTDQSFATIVLSEKGTYRGMHFPGTPFSIIRESSPEQMAWVKNHESVHNFIDGAWRIKDSHGLVREFSSLTKHHFQPVEGKATPTITDHINSLHNEMLAALEKAEEVDFGWTGKHKDNHELFETYINNLFTAGKRVREGTEIVLQYIQKTKNKEGRQRAVEFVTAWQNKLVTVVDTMRRSLNIGREIGDEALRQVHILFFILPPNNYRHIEKYLRHTYSDEIVDKASAKMGKNSDENELSEAPGIDP